jgi:predicted aminopeptidase
MIYLEESESRGCSNFGMIEKRINQTGHRNIPLKLAGIIILTSMLSGCAQMSYLKQAALGQIYILNHRRPIQKVLEDKNTQPITIEKLNLVLKAKKFAETELQLNPTKNFETYVELKDPYVSYIVSASPKNELKIRKWNFWIVGEFPYLGFFEKEGALDEEKKLITLGLDTYVRGASAYSTLGWFNDPLLSSTARLPDPYIVDTVIHESVHTTVFYKNQVEFNESLASFYAEKATVLYFRSIEGPNSKTAKRIEDQSKDSAEFAHFIDSEIKDLQSWYHSHPNSSEDSRRVQFEKIQNKFKTSLLPKMKTDQFAWFKDANLNNARLLALQTYSQGSGDFDQLYNQTGKNLVNFLAKIKGLDATDPYGGLKKQIKRLKTE